MDKPTLYFGQHLHGLKYVTITSLYVPIISHYILYMYIYIYIYRANVFPMMFPKSSICSRGFPSRDDPGGALVESLTLSFQRAANELIRDGPSGMAGGDPSGLKEQRLIDLIDFERV